MPCLWVSSNGDEDEDVDQVRRQAGRLAGWLAGWQAGRSTRGGCRSIEWFAGNAPDAPVNWLQLTANAADLSQPLRPH